MPALPAKHYAAELQRQLRSLLGHEQIVTQAYGRHLLIKRLDDEEPTVVARLTELGRNRYGAAFRTHSGRWEPLPGTGLARRDGPARRHAPASVFAAR
ncbi:hypothetical protein ACU4HD_45440 (plasmid) [Cupriavidus basilensis]